MTTDAPDPKRLGRPPKRPEERYAKVAISLPPAHIAWVDGIAANTGRDRSAVIQDLIARAMAARARTRRSPTA